VRFYDVMDANEVVESSAKFAGSIPQLVQAAPDRRLARGYPGHSDLGRGLEPDNSRL